MTNFYAVPIHYQGSRGIYSVLGNSRVIAPEVNDNDYRTFSTNNTFVAQTFGASETENTDIDAVFIKAQGVTQFSVSVPSGMGSGTGVTNRAWAGDVTTPERTTISTTINQFQHQLLDLRRNEEEGEPDRTLNAREVQLEFSGSNVRIYEIMLLRILLTLDAEATYVNADHVLRNNTLLRQNIRGSSFSIKSLASRSKWHSTYTARFNEFTTTSYEDFMGFVQDNQNFVFAPQYNRYPNRVYPATWGDDSFRNAYVSRRYSSGIQVSYNILEA